MIRSWKTVFGASSILQDIELGFGGSNGQKEVTTVNASEHTGEPGSLLPSAPKGGAASEPALAAVGQMQGPFPTQGSLTAAADHLWETLSQIIRELRELRASLPETPLSETPLTRQEAADYLKVHPDTLFRWATEGKVTYSKLGNAIRFR